MWCSLVRGFIPHILWQQAKSWVYFLAMGALFWWLPPIALAIAGTPPSEGVAHLFGEHYGIVIVISYVTALVTLESAAAFLRLKRASPLEDPRLLASIERMAKDAKLTRVPVFSILKGKPNAAALGSMFSGGVVISMGNAHKIMDDTAEDAVYAHEMAHIKHKDSLASALKLAGGRAFAFQLWLLGAGLVFGVLATGNGTAEEWWFTLKAFGVTLLLLGVYTLLGLAHSRTREYLADMGALALMGHAYANDIIRGILMLGEIGYNMQPREMLGATETWWLRTHPTTAERARALGVRISLNGSSVVAHETSVRAA